VLGVHATALDPKAHTVTLNGHVEPLRYDKLLLATGSRVRHLDVPGIDNVGVRYLRTITEADALLGDLRQGAPGARRGGRVDRAWRRRPRPARTARG